MPVRSAPRGSSWEDGPSFISIPALPDATCVHNAAGLPPAGRIRVEDVYVGIGRPAAVDRRQGGLGADTGLWVTDDPVAEPVTSWRRLAGLYSGTGLWPLLLMSLAAVHDHRPWHSGELDPVPLARVDALETTSVLAEGWADSLVPMGENPYVEHLRPFGAAFPGLAEPLRRERTPCEVPVDALRPWAPWRLGLVPCRRPADTVALIGWHGAINSRRPEQVSAVLRSWEDRFGMVVVALGFATLTLLVPRPPEDEAEALPLAAELAALCPDVLSADGPLDGFGYRSGGTIGGLARLLVSRSVWTLWWD
jgi:hypothetical protein